MEYTDGNKSDADGNILFVETRNFDVVDVKLSTEIRLEQVNYVRNQWSKQWRENRKIYRPFDVRWLSD